MVTKIENPRFTFTNQGQDNFKKNVESVVIIISASSETFLIRVRLKRTHCRGVLYYRGMNCVDYLLSILYI